MSAFRFHLRRKKPVVLFHNPKVAGQTIRDGVFAGKWRRGDDGPKHPRRLPPYWDLSRSFGFVREPMDRFASGVRFCAKNPRCGERALDLGWVMSVLEDPAISFMEHRLSPAHFLKHHLIRQSDWNVGLDLVRHLGRFEDFEGELRRILAQMGIKIGEIPHRNKTRGGHWSMWVPAEWEDRVVAYLAPDFERFGYPLPGGKTGRGRVIRPESSAGESRRRSRLGR